MHATQRHTVEFEPDIEVRVIIDVERLRHSESQDKLCKVTPEPAFDVMDAAFVLAVGHEVVQKNVISDLILWQCLIVFVSNLDSRLSIQR